MINGALLMWTLATANECVRFGSTTWLSLTFLPSYVMRLDTDSCLTSKMEINPRQYLYGNKIEHMHHSTFHEFPGVIEELKDFVI